MNIGAGWIKKGKKSSFISCEVRLPLLGSFRFGVFKNEDKKKEKEPDYLISFFSDNIEKNDGGDQKPGNEDFLPGG